MANPILQKLNQRVQPTQGIQKNNPLQMISEFQKFKKQMQGKNPEQIVKGLISSGQMSQQQFEELKKEAMTLTNILK
nr:hypothetical protein [uncultured Lachnoclostridium sp.]